MPWQIIFHKDLIYKNYLRQIPPGHHYTTKAGDISTTSSSIHIIFITTWSDRRYVIEEIVNLFDRRDIFIWHWDRGSWFLSYVAGDSFVEELYLLWIWIVCSTQGVLVVLEKPGVKPLAQFGVLKKTVCIRVQIRKSNRIPSTKVCFAIMCTKCKNGLVLLDSCTDEKNCFYFCFRYW